ncbi:MAG: pentapeptide repeat-containing protein [Prochloraceae cyanobacterium]|nr:pentapeptide repeat-containing protein [Prochloraceae cyanobacterium]
MANRRHLKILKQGIETWNRWRKENSDIKPNLRGANLKGEKLAQANFSDCDIRSANFSNADLKNANFQRAVAGLERRWATLLVLSSWFLSLISGFFSARAGYLVAQIFEPRTLEDQITGWVSLIVLIIFFFVTIRQGIGLGLVAFAFTVAIVFAIAGTVVGVGVFSIAFAEAFVFAVAGAVGGAFVVAGTGAGVFAGAGAISGAVAFAAVFAIAGAIAIAETEILALIITFLTAYIAWQALNGNEKYALIRKVAIAFAAIGGTSFRSADLTDVDFTAAKLKSTDIRYATVIRTCWKRTYLLDRVRLGSSYLQNPRVQKLLVYGQGKNQNFDLCNLRGVNLKGANLTNASFIGADLREANLQKANLSGAKLIQTELDGTDLTGAILTGATIEKRSLTANTKLDEIKCQYVFMRLPSIKDLNPCRQPPNWEEEFKNGDFTVWISPQFDSIDFYHNSNVDPDAIAISFKLLAENNPEANLEILSIERLGKDKIMLRVSSSEEVAHPRLTLEYFEIYNKIRTDESKEYKKSIAEKDPRIKQLSTMLRTVLQDSSFYSQRELKSANIIDRNVPQDKVFSLSEVIQLIALLEEAIATSPLSEKEKNKIVAYLIPVKQELKEPDPDLEQIKLSLEAMTKKISKLGQSADTANSLHQQVEPIFSLVASWTGMKNQG